MTNMTVVQTAYSVARGMGASDKVMLALFEAAIVESGFENLSHGDRDSVGYLQQRPSQGWPNPMDVPTATRSFVSKATPIQDRYSTSGQVAQAVQRSAFPLKYDAVRAQAATLLAQVGGSTSAASTLGGTNTGWADGALWGAGPKALEAFFGEKYKLPSLGKMLDVLRNKNTYVRGGLIVGGVGATLLAISRSTGL